MFLRSAGRIQLDPAGSPSPEIAKSVLEMSHTHFYFSLSRPIITTHAHNSRRETSLILSVKICYVVIAQIQVIISRRNQPVYISAVTHFCRCASSDIFNQLLWVQEFLVRLGMPMCLLRSLVVPLVQVSNYPDVITYNLLLFLTKDPFSSQEG